MSNSNIKRCNYCGTINLVGSNKCKACGRKLISKNKIENVYIDLVYKEDSLENEIASEKIEIQEIIEVDNSDNNKMKLEENIPLSKEESIIEKAIIFFMIAVIVLIVIFLFLLNNFPSLLPKYWVEISPEPTYFNFILLGIEYGLDVLGLVMCPNSKVFRKLFSLIMKVVCGIIIYFLLAIFLISLIPSGCV